MSGFLFGLLMFIFGFLYSNALTRENIAGSGVFINENIIYHCFKKDKP